MKTPRQLVRAALAYAEAAGAVQRCQEALGRDLQAWRAQRDAEQAPHSDCALCDARIARLAVHARSLQRAKSRERRTKAKLLALARQGGAQC